ncbi:glycine zipper 2TM domain-containing protein [Paraburkholderia caffeinilytica]|uniref:glycine zipper 2TM domain-containing protein n=1 Tax=Paraburkholderia caffeinilytica TaxID=1761016 RepID=UPI003DA0205C
MTSVEPVQVEPSSTGLGAIGGAAAGALAGHQFGNGRGKMAATIVGGLAGAFGGNMAENRIRSSTVWRVHLQMEDGSSRILTYPTQPSVYAGQRVHVNGDLLRAG